MDHSEAAAAISAGDTKAYLNNVLDRAADAIRQSDAAAYVEIKRETFGNSCQSLMVYFSDQMIILARVDEQKDTLSLISRGLSIVRPGYPADMCPGRGRICFRDVKPICVRKGEIPDDEAVQRVINGITEAARTILSLSV